MDTRILLASNGGRHGPRVTSHESPVTSCKLFRFTLLSKNASANHLESHSCKNKGLKVPCFHTLTKNIRGEGAPWGFPSGRRLFSWPPRSRWKESRALLRFGQASPATGRNGSSRRRSRDGRRGVCGNALRRPPRRPS